MIFEILENRSQLEKGEEGSNAETTQLTIHLIQVYTLNFFKVILDLSVQINLQL
jgi:hypothetical protein